MNEVTCVGILCSDVLVKPVDSMPPKGKLQLVDQLQLQVGGCAANASIDLARIGIKTGIIGKVGQDGFGKFILNTLIWEGLDIRGLRVDESVSTSASIVVINQDGERTILHCLGSNGKFSFDDIDLNIVKDSKVLFIAGTFLMPEFDGYGTLNLLKFAKENGITTCVDTAWDSSGLWIKKIGSSLAFIDWFMPSYEEAKELSNESLPEDITEFFISKGVKNVVIKLGEDGCFVRCKNEHKFYSPAYRNVKVIDTSGAGDAFCAGFIAGIVKGWDVKKVAAFANAVGGHCVMEIGTTKGIKSMEQILAFMNKN